MMSNFINKFVHQKALAVSSIPFTENELNNIVLSWSNAVQFGENSDELVNSIDWSKLKDLLKEVGHKSYKNWSLTENSSDILKTIIGTPYSSASFQCIFQRVLHGGGWYAAAEAATLKSNNLDIKPSIHKPWIVMIAGVNGIRKTTSVYQHWFKDVLYEALGETYSGTKEELPDGANSFFRQLDYIMATVVSEEFKYLYSELELDNKLDNKNISEYSAAKDAIFARYRTVAEMVGILLLKEGRDLGMNIVVETSGRDISSFNYINQFFNETVGRNYRKLIVHMTIDDLKYAENSVDTRMKREMELGKEVVTALSKDKQNMNNYKQLVCVNSGGPYGSHVLRNVQSESDSVWSALINPLSENMGDDVGNDWYKAHICVNACELADGNWSVNAKGSDLKFFFENKRINT